MIDGFVAALAFILALTAGIYFFGYAARQASVLYITALEIIFGSFIIIPLLLFSENLNIYDIAIKPDRENWLWLGAASLSGFIGGNFFSLINLKTAGERTNSLLSPAITACSVLLAIVVFNEPLTLTKLTGFILTLSAVTLFVLSKTKDKENANTKAALWSAFGTVICLTLTIICSVYGTIHTHLSIMHTVLLRLIIALPVILIAFIVFKPNRSLKSASPIKFFGAIAGGIITQTIFANYLWFYCTYKIGIAAFQVIIATLPFFVYAADVYVFKRTKPSGYFLFAAFFAGLGIWMAMR